jgi:hypothetical protein
MSIFLKILGSKSIKLAQTCIAVGILSLTCTTMLSCDTLAKSSDQTQEIASISTVLPPKGSTVSAGARGARMEAATPARAESPRAPARCGMLGRAERNPIAD